MVRRGIISLGEAQKKIAQEITTYTKKLNQETLEDEKQDRLTYAKDRMQVALKEAKEQKKINKSTLKELAKEEKALRQAIRKEKDKEAKKDLKRQIIIIEAEAKKQKAENKKALKAIKQERKGARKAINADATSAKEKYETRIRANEYDVRAQIGQNLNNEINSFLNSFKNMFQSTIETYGNYQSKINVRLQGLEKTWQGTWGFNGVEDTLTKAIGTNPIVKLKDVFDNVVKALDSGISYNVEQRAFLETIKDEVAATFDAFNSNLTRIIKLQQQDSTAARLGLESTLTQYFNANFSDTSYLAQNVSDSVSTALTEALAQMSTTQGVEFEYQVQKWLGSLYSVGFDSSTISNIANAIGMLGSGNVSGLEGSAMQNLIVMSASRIGKSYADLLTGGLTAQTTNELLKSMVSYLKEIASTENKVVKSQYASIYGLSTSDLVAAKNLDSRISKISESSLNYSQAVGEVYNQMNQIYNRLSIGQMLDNAKSNLIYSMGKGIASNPASYALWEITSMIEDLTGGINLPTVSVLGNSVDLNTTVTNLMRAGLVGVSTLGSIGDIISGVGSTINPSSMLSKLGISADESALKRINRGKGLNRRNKLVGDLSSSTMVGNSAGSDYSDAAILEANKKADTLLDVKKQEYSDLTVNDIHQYLLQVFDPKITDIEKMIAYMTGSKFNTNS